MGNTFTCVPSKKRKTLGGYLHRKFTSKKRKTDKPYFQQEDAEEGSEWREQDKDNEGEEYTGAEEKSEKDCLETKREVKNDSIQILEETCKPLDYPVEDEEYASDEQPVFPEILLGIQKAPSPGPSPRDCKDQGTKVTENPSVDSSRNHVKKTWTFDETVIDTKYNWHKRVEEFRNMPCPGAGDHDCDDEEEENRKLTEPVKQETKTYNPDDWADFYAALEGMQDEEEEDKNTDNYELVMCRSDHSDDIAVDADDTEKQNNDWKPADDVMPNNADETKVDIDDTNGEENDEVKMEHGSPVSVTSDKIDIDECAIDRVQQHTELDESDEPVIEKSKEMDTDTLALETVEIPTIQLNEEPRPKGSGILRKYTSGVSGCTIRRNVTWGPDVKPPAPEYDVTDSVSKAFKRERSRLDELKALEQRHMLNKNERAGQKPVNSARVGMVTKGCRAPTPYKQRKVPTRDIAMGKCASTAATKGPDRGIVWPNKIEEVYSSTAKAYFVEQFQRTELFRSRSRKMNDGNVTWMKALTPFQVWVIEHAGSIEIEAILNPKPKLRPSKAKAKVSCWRNDTSVPQRNHQMEK